MSRVPLRPGIWLAAPASGSGKTTVAIALIACLRRRGLRVAALKAGPDFIDGGYHGAAGASFASNLDGWAMTPETFESVIAEAEASADVVIGEGMMGLFDGAVGSRGSTAELSRRSGWPVGLVVDAGSMAASAAALVHGFATFDPDLRVAGVFFNRVGGPGHAKILRGACSDSRVPVLACLPAEAGLTLSERHLGLQLAEESPSVGSLVMAAADWLEAHCDVDGFLSILEGATPPSPEALPAAAAGTHVPLAPLGQRIAIARDAAFAFRYEHLLRGWVRAGAELSFFSPLAGECPLASADAIFLPGGYPELHGPRIAASTSFLAALRSAAAGGRKIYGECGGFMVLGRRLQDADGRHHEMAGVLPVESSMLRPSMVLGYRRAALRSDGPLGPAGSRFLGQEFRFAATRDLPGSASPLFDVTDATGESRTSVGLAEALVAGSFVHLLDMDV